MPKELHFTLDETCISWYDYQFQDTILRNDIVWRAWRSVIQRNLTAQQRAGMACAICNTCITPAQAAIEYVGGYRLATCPPRCPSALEQSISSTIDRLAKPPMQA